MTFNLPPIFTLFHYQWNLIQKNWTDSQTRTLVDWIYVAHVHCAVHSLFFFNQRSISVFHAKLLRCVQFTSEHRTLSSNGIQIRTRKTEYQKDLRTTKMLQKEYYDEVHCIAVQCRSVKRCEAQHGVLNMRQHLQSLS